MTHAKPHRLKLLLALLACIGVAIATFLLVRDPEPTYKGKPLRKWLAQITIQQSATQWEAQDAIKTIGTNALPFLLKWIAFEDTQASPLRRVVARTTIRFPRLQRIKGLNEWMRAETVNTYGIPDVFEALGPQAISAIPTLTHLANTSTNPMTPYLAAQALLKIGPPALPALNNVLTNQLSPNREAAINGLSRLGASASAATPFLLQCLQDEKRSILQATVETLGDMGQPEPNLVVPALTNLLTRLSINTRADVYFAAAITGVLHHYNVTAYAATPTLVQFLRQRQFATAAWQGDMYALMSITDSPEVLVPYFTACLDSTNGNQATMMALYLPNLGPQATVALPALTNALQNSTRELHLAISNAIVQITSQSPQAQ